MWIQIVMDQCCGFKFYTLNLDPDPGFWPNLDSELDPGLNQQFTSKSFAYILSYNYMCASGSVFGICIRIQKAPEYGSNKDSDPQQWCGPRFINKKFTFSM